MKANPKHRIRSVVTMRSCDTFMALALAIAVVSTLFITSNGHAAGADLQRLDKAALSALCKQAALANAHETRESWIEVSQATGEVAGASSAACVATGVRHDNASDGAGPQKRMWLFVVTLVDGSVVIDPRARWNELPI